jgi:hypothetical protein
MREESGYGRGAGNCLLGRHQRLQDLPRIKLARSHRGDKPLDVLAAGDRNKALAAVGGKVGSTHPDGTLKSRQEVFKLSLSS